MGKFIRERQKKTENKSSDVVDENKTEDMPNSTEVQKSENEPEYYDWEFGEEPIKEDIQVETSPRTEPIETEDDNDKKLVKTKPKKELSEARKRQLENARKKSRQAYKKRRETKKQEKERLEKEAIEIEIERQIAIRLKAMGKVQEAVPEPVRKVIEKPKVIENNEILRRTRIVEQYKPPVIEKVIETPAEPVKSKRQQDMEDLAKSLGWDI